MPGGQGAQIVLERIDGVRADRLRAYKVELDGERAGEIRAGETLTLAAAPGKHTLKLRIDWASSPELELDLQPGAELRAECAPAIRDVPWWAIAPKAIRLSLFRRSQWIELSARGD